ncbi:TrkH family potassium uptake protein [Ruminococcus sp. XPD3002]|uniref:TrkH family potassium uptake protein n=1 Tax=Ruminococcus sp. XPD3002 TaxID=1452269 RepID=UPI00091A77F1|nr:trk system potassium uptake protein TrkH [Ruminococcus flavefaciens]
MNYKMIIYIMGQILKVVGLFMLLPIIVGLIYGEDHVITSFGIPFAALMIVSLIITAKKPKNNAIFSMEGFVSVAASWIAMSLIGAVPFVISGEIPHYPDALFETVSGFTTTGATILSDVEAMSKSCLFWRAFTHWLGGMGVLMFVLAVMSSNDSRTMHMMRAECAGPNVGRLVSKSKFSARILYGIYISLTVAEAVLLMCGGVPLYDAVLHACSSAGTGGFSMWGDSIGHYNSVYVEMVVAIFIILFGVNFNLYYYLIIRKFSLAFKNEEVRTYFGIIIAATLIITFNVMKLYNGFGDSLRHSFFMVASTITSAGFSTTDTAQWPMFSQTLLLLLMFVGSCAGSTGGGMKVSRIMIIIKTGIKELKYIVSPRAVATVKMDGKPVEKDVVRGASNYLILFIMLMCISLLLITLDNFTIEESASAVITCMNNIGFGVGAFGPAGNLGGLSSFSKIVLCFDMLLGRLEIYPLIMLFVPKKNS